MIIWYIKCLIQFMHDLNSLKSMLEFPPIQNFQLKAFFFFFFSCCRADDPLAINLVHAFYWDGKPNSTTLLIELNKVLLMLCSSDQYCSGPFYNIRHCFCLFTSQGLLFYQKKKKSRSFITEKLLHL